MFTAALVAIAVCLVAMQCYSNCGKGGGGGGAVEVAAPSTAVALDHEVSPVVVGSDLWEVYIYQSSGGFWAFVLLPNVVAGQAAVAAGTCCLAVVGKCKCHRKCE